MLKGFILLGAATLGVPAFLATSAASEDLPKLVFAGSGSNLGITRVLVDAFRRRHASPVIEVPESIGSTGGIRAVADGAIALGLVSRPLRGDEQRLGLAVVPYAKTAIIIGAHEGVPDDQITFEDLVAIYARKKTRWSDGREIMVLTREPGDSSIEVLERVVPGFRKVYREGIGLRRWTVLYRDQEMSAVLARTPSTIGLSDTGAVATEHLRVKALKVNGIAPTPDQVLARRYPLMKTVSFVFRKDRLDPSARAFIDFVLSAEGRRVLSANRLSPAE